MMKLILTLISISALLGIMDLIKFHFEQSIFSKILKPEWLRRWINPHEYLFTSKNGIILWLLGHSLAGLNDFWHFLKFIVLQLIFLLAWWNHMEGEWYAFFIMCNLGYGVIFELFYTAIFTINKKKK